MSLSDLPSLPACHAELARYIAEHPEQPIVDIIEPYRRYESRLREVYAQDRQNPALNDPTLNVLPLFTEDTRCITTRARDLASEPEEVKSRYIMPLPDDKRRPNGSPATVADLAEFQKNFNVFSESSLVDLDWSNVVAAGSSVVNCLLPVPREFNTTKRKLREYYHQKFCPASDVDLFLYGLTHDEALDKIKQIERAVRDALLNEVTVVRTKYALTIASQYPVRHIQIVLRVYKSVSEILTGFDIDAAGGAFDGKQVYVTPRALGSFITQINHIDLSRRSPSYENRLSKYSHRNFEVYWPELDRARVDPTIFERSFKRTLGLARLLVLERLPTTSAREAYLNKRRQERGRPTFYRGHHFLGGNIKENHEDEVADWLSEEEVSSYHTFTVPYGEKFHAKRIEKLCYTRDLLLNAEWNQPKDRGVYLHRHPAFFGRVEDVIEDCCGSCPVPVTEEEKEVAAKEAEIYISGKVSFMIDDPGRQQIGSFNPLTEQDWTDMAYVGNTARLCQSIVDGDVDDVLNWLSQSEADPNKRDYTGRSPLHLAVMASTPKVVKCLIDHGARLTARLADGRTALHLAASRGNAEMIRLLMEKSIENEEAEEEKQDRRRQASKVPQGVGASPEAEESEDGSSEDSENKDEDGDEEDEDEDEDGELVGLEEDVTDVDQVSTTTGSYVKVTKDQGSNEDKVLDESDDEPDYYQIDVLAWDVPCSPLHLAIAGGHEDAVKLLCDYGADSILPIKFLSNNNNNDDSDETAAILTLSLALTLPLEQAKSMAKLLLNLGAVSSQADRHGTTAFQRYVESGKMAMIDTLLENDKTGVKTALNHIVFTGYSWSPRTAAPIHSAVEKGDSILVLKLLNAGASAEIDFETWLKAAKISPLQSGRLRDLEANKAIFRQMEQPIVAAVRRGDPDIATALLERGADPNALTTETQELLVNEYRRRWTRGMAVLDLVQKSIDGLKSELDRASTPRHKPQLTPGMDTFLDKFEPGTYQRWLVSADVDAKVKNHESQMKTYEDWQREEDKSGGESEKRKLLGEILVGLEKLKEAIVLKGGKTFAQQYPDIKTADDNSSAGSSDSPKDAPKPYDYIFTFKHDKDVTERRRDGYIELMEAAWRGDVERIKALTLQAWGEHQDQPPLKMAITDLSGNSPFSLAFVRGHYDVARTILNIVGAQWSPTEQDKVRYKIKEESNFDGDDDDTTYSDEDDSDEGGDPVIVSEKIDAKFTIDDIGKVSMQVQSNVKPLEIVLSSTTLKMEGKQAEPVPSRTLFVHCFDTDDMTGLKLLLDLAQHWAAHKFPSDGGSDNHDQAATASDDQPGGSSFSFPHADFQWAIEHGKTQLLALVIRRTGAGIPLDHLVKKSGVELKHKPRYYQGLTVYGKKRRDWATAGRNMVVKTTGLKTPPLLHAALGGRPESTEFFLSDAPHRIYAEFGKSQAAKDDSRLKHLKDSPGGFDRAISKWLGADNDLVIHCAVLAEPSPQANELLDYLIQTCPTALEKKSSNGDTPLLVAARLGRTQFVRILIDGNADQSARNAKGENILHMALAGNPSAHRLRPLLECLDPELRRHLFLQRKNLSENGTAPLQAWVAQACGVDTDSGRSRRHYWYTAPKPPYDEREKDALDVLRLLLEFSSPATTGAVEESTNGLDMLNGAGDTCLHTAIMHHNVAIAKALIHHRPSLLYRENAVGRTPAEVAYDTLTASQLAKPDSNNHSNNNGDLFRTFSRRDASEFAADAAVKALDASTIRAQLRDLGLDGDYSAEEVTAIHGSTGLAGLKPARRAGEHLAKQAIWDFCSGAMQRHPGARRLVSLNEANDVARRLGEQETGSRYFSVEARKDEYEDEDDKEDKDDDKAADDFAAKELSSRISRAWAYQSSEEKAEELGLQRCGDCKFFHE